MTESLVPPDGRTNRGLVEASRGVLLQEGIEVGARGLQVDKGASGVVQQSTLRSDPRSWVEDGSRTGRLGRSFGNTAGVVKLVNTGDLKSPGLRPLRVQVPPSASDKGNQDGARDEAPAAAIGVTVARELNRPRFSCLTMHWAKVAAVISLILAAGPAAGQSLSVPPGTRLRVQMGQVEIAGIFRSADARVLLLQERGAPEPTPIPLESIERMWRARGNHWKLGAAAGAVVGFLGGRAWQSSIREGRSLEGPEHVLSFAGAVLGGAGGGAIGYLILKWAEVPLDLVQGPPLG